MHGTAGRKGAALLLRGEASVSEESVRPLFNFTALCGKTCWGLLVKLTAVLQRRMGFRDSISIWHRLVFPNYSLASDCTIISLWLECYSIITYYGIRLWSLTTKSPFQCQSATISLDCLHSVDHGCPIQAHIGPEFTTLQIWGLTELFNEISSSVKYFYINPNKFCFKLNIKKVKHNTIPKIIKHIKLQNFSIGMEKLIHYYYTIII